MCGCFVEYKSSEIVICSFLNFKNDLNFVVVFIGYVSICLCTGIVTVVVEVISFPYLKKNIALVQVL